MRYLKNFETENEQQECADKYKYVSYTVETDKVHIHKRDYSSDYLTIVPVSDGTIIYGNQEYLDDFIPLSYSTDGGETWSSPSSYMELNLTAGNKVMLKGIYDIEYEYNRHYNFYKQSETAYFNIEGNIMSLAYGDNFVGETTLTAVDIFYKIFTGLDIIDAKNMILPATTLTKGCYDSMFKDCTSLVSAPELPATDLTMSVTIPYESGCYSAMFSGCTSLVKAPDLPATTLGDYCYNGMFSGCTALTQTPKLHSTSLAKGCYSDMFGDCTALTTAPVLPATTLANNCYSGMFNGCTNLTNAPELPGTPVKDSCYSNMFTNCTSLVSAPELPSPTAARSCYNSMFRGCTNLTKAPSVIAPAAVEWDCCEAMFGGCTSLTKAPDLPAAVLAERCYLYMFTGCTSLNYIKMLATDISANACLNGWVERVASNGTFVKNANMTTLPSGSYGIPSGWTVQDAT